MDRHRIQSRAYAHAPIPTPHPNAGGAEATRWPGRFALLCVLLGMIGCSSFHRDWKAAAGSGPPHGLEGRWEGTWHSDVNDHRNQLLCMITRPTNGVISARFHAKYRKIFTWSFNYTVPLTVPSGDTVTMWFVAM
jgi:hypothetical protein